MATFPFRIYAILASDGALGSLETGRYPSSLCLPGGGGGESRFLSGMVDGYSSSLQILALVDWANNIAQFFGVVRLPQDVSVNIHHRDSASDGQLFCLFDRPDVRQSPALVQCNILEGPLSRFEARPLVTSL